MRSGDECSHAGRQNRSVDERCDKCRQQHENWVSTAFLLLINTVHFFVSCEFAKLGRKAFGVIIVYFCCMLIQHLTLIDGCRYRSCILVSEDLCCAITTYVHSIIVNVSRPYEADPMITSHRLDTVRVLSRVRMHTSKGKGKRGFV